MFDDIRTPQRTARRDRSALEINIAADVEVHKAPTEKDRMDFTGTLEQIAYDFTAARKLGAAEIVIIRSFSVVETAKKILSFAWKSSGGSQSKVDGWSRAFYN